MNEDRSVCVGLDTHKATIAVAVAEPGRSGEVRFCGAVANRPEAVRPAGNETGPVFFLDPMSLSRRGMTRL